MKQGREKMRISATGCFQSDRMMSPAAKNSKGQKKVIRLSVSVDYAKGSISAR